MLESSNVSNRDFSLNLNLAQISANLRVVSYALISRVESGTSRHIMALFGRRFRMLR